MKKTCLPTCTNCSACIAQNTSKKRTMTIRSCEVSNACKILIPCKVGDIRADAIADSGAECNVVNSRLCKGLRLFNTHDVLLNADGKPMELKGLVELPISFSAKGYDEPINFPIIAYSVENLKSDLILGFPFLEKYKANADWGTHQFTITHGKNKIQIAFPRCDTTFLSEGSLLVDKEVDNLSLNINALTYRKPPPPKFGPPSKIKIPQNLPKSSDQNDFTQSSNPNDPNYRPPYAINEPIRHFPEIETSDPQNTTPDSNNSPSIENFDKYLRISKEFILEPNTNYLLLELRPKQKFCPTRKFDYKLNLKIVEKGNKIYVHNINDRPKRLRKNQAIGFIYDENEFIQGRLPLVNTYFNNNGIWSSTNEYGEQAENYNERNGHTNHELIRKKYFDYQKQYIKSLEEMNVPKNKIEELSDKHWDKLLDLPENASKHRVFSKNIFNIDDINNSDNLNINFINKLRKDDIEFVSKNSEENLNPEKYERAVSRNLKINLIDIEYKFKPTPVKVFCKGNKEILKVIDNFILKPKETAANVSIIALLMLKWLNASIIKTPRILAPVAICSTSARIK
ncbi:hypothetical protein V9T40_014902 [Parthenolecanium corni]|uniref:Uncharacterized protein n=1 Tax=Parthenolecanium corni TaxID=536013 RepID=A0AAN9TJK4_9HEMI